MWYDMCRTHSLRLASDVSFHFISTRARGTRAFGYLRIHTEFLYRLAVCICRSRRTKMTHVIYVTHVTHVTHVTQEAPSDRHTQW